MDVNIGNTADCALNDLFRFVGLEETDPQFISDIYNKTTETKSTIYRWLVGLTLGRNFRNQRLFIKNLVENYLDPKIELPDVDIKNRTESTLTESINNYIYLVLELYEYGRLSKITLDNNQDPRELFLALAFLISKDKWFKNEDYNSLEIMGLKDIVVEYASTEFEFLNITESDLELVKKYNLMKENESVNGVKTNNITNTKKDKFKLDVSGGQSDEITEKVELFQQIVIQFASDIISKATLLSRRKTVRSYDSELLRLIMGKSEYEKQFLKSIDNIYSNETDMNKEAFDISAYNEDFSENISDPNEWNELIGEIVHLSNIIVQLQFKLRDLSKSIESNDKDRLKYFSKVTDEMKNYRKNDTTQGQSTFISDRYKQPSPVEFLFISDELLFKRHMSIMNVINRSLDNETRRSNFWMNALDILKKIEASPKTNENKGFNYKPTNSDSNNNILTIYCDSLDFLRQVNVKFANYKAGQVADEHGRKTTFSMFVNNEIENAEKKGLVNRSDIENINESVKKLFHLYEQVDVRNARMAVPLLGKWIDGTEDFESIPSTGGKNLSESLINSISDSKTEEYEQLEKANFRIIENIVNEVYEPEPIDPKDQITKTISDIVNYDYYFNMCKENDEMLKDMDIDCLGFSKEVEKLILQAIDCTEKTLDKSDNNLQRISDFIGSETPLHLIR